jgi:hypothetical protein
MTTRKDKLRAAWMAQFETKLIELKPALAGKIDWDTATFFFNQGLAPVAAAEHVAARS